MPTLPPDGENLAYPARRVLNIDAKRRIAQLVARDVPDGARRVRWLRYVMPEAR